MGTFDRVKYCQLKDGGEIEFSRNKFKRKNQFSKQEPLMIIICHSDRNGCNILRNEIHWKIKKICKISKFKKNLKVVLFGDSSKFTISTAGCFQILG